MNALIIAVDRKLRNKKLLSDLKELNFFEKIDILKAVVPENLEVDFIAKQKLESGKMLFRSISDAEVATKESHRFAYEYSLSTGTESTFIFEDDAIIKNKKELLQSLRNLEKFSKPTIVSFYSPYWSIWFKHKKRIKSLFPPAGAVAYIINRSAMEKSQSPSSYGLADWPNWASEVCFLLNPIDCIDHLNLGSNLELSRSVIKNQKISTLEKFFKFLKAPLKSGRESVLYPLLWKVLVRLLELSGKRLKGDNRRIIFF
jgi:hypothetical protein